MSADDSGSGFSAHFSTLILTDDARRQHPTVTIVPDDGRTEEPIQLPLIRTGTNAGHTQPELSLRGTLGEGGMGIVHLARQVPLSRDVAVKRPRVAGDPRAAERVLHEALVTGLLEHPNVVPIHVLGRDEEGTPLIVMKRVEGVSWLEVMADPSVSPTDDEINLEWHVGVLIQVCNALRFAHSRGVIHRDIKPENVMVGGFGEVYLVDWGIAISTVENEDGRITQREEARGVAGTPAYMAPEMTEDDASDIDERTDVYLLGATLHEVMTGSPPHSGRSLFEVMLSAYESKPPDYGHEVPEELAAIARRAMTVSRDERYPTVDAFRDALVAFLEHRTAVAIANEAEDRLVIARDRVAALDVDEEGVLAEVSALFAETRFGFQQALQQWPEYDRAHRGLDDLVRLQFEHQIQRGDESAAAALLAQIGDDEVLQRQLDALRAEKAREREEVERLRQLERDQDLTIGWRTRIALGVGVAGFWGLSAWVKAYSRHGIAPDDLEPAYLESLLYTLGVPVLLVVAFRKLFTANAFNRRLVYLLMATLLGIGLMRVVAYLMDVPLIVTTAFEFVLYGFAATTLGVMTDIRIAASAIVIFAAAIGAALYPSVQMVLIGIAVFIFAAHQGYVWRPGLFMRDDTELDGDKTETES